MKNCVLILLLLNSPFGGWGANDIAFYNLYANYLVAMTEEGAVFAPDDSTALLSMANLCPIEYGASVYKARALYNSIYGMVVMYEDCNSGEARFASNMQSAMQTEDWTIELFPNPAQNEITFKSNYETENLNIVVTDVLGREILNTSLKISSFVANVKLDLMNGAYVVRLVNNQNKIISKKLLIAK